MSQHATLVSAEDLVELIRSAAPEIIGDATAETSFDHMEVDSLSLVEIAVMISQKYGFTLHDWEIAEAGSFAALSEIVSARQVPEEAR